MKTETVNTMSNETNMLEEQLKAYKDSNLIKDETIKNLKAKMADMVEMTLTYQPYIPTPPVQNPTELYNRACSNDSVTITSWFDQWISQIKINSESFDFEEQSVMSEFAKFAGQPVIVAGSGPSLKKNAAILADKEKRHDIPVVSCLHNFAYFQDLGIEAQYYVNLDAGDITIGEMSQGGEKDEEYYWEQTKDKTLVAVIHSHPELLKRWKGKILFFNAIVADPRYIEEMRKITEFKTVFNVGGNTLGACLYMSRAILGASMTAFVGADFCFSYNRKFHPFDSPYDQKFAGVIPWTDIYGNRVYTWQSYLNFKYWFDFIACGGRGNHPGIFVNCTEGGILGSYTEGNIQQIQQRSLDEFLHMVNLHKALPKTIEERPNEAVLLF